MRACVHARAHACLIQFWIMHNLQYLHEAGIRQTDVRLRDTIKKMQELQSVASDESVQIQELLLDKETFIKYVMLYVCWLVQNMIAL